MKFLYPGWLYFLLLLPLGFGLLLLDEKRRKTLFSSFIPPVLWDRIVPDLKPGYREKKGVLFLAGVGFLLLALARPQFGSHDEEVTTTGLDLMVVLDVSSSMEVEDVVPSRLKKAKHLVKTMLEQLGGDRVGVVAFADGASLACPLTTDLDYVGSTVELLDPRSIQSQGTDVGTGLDTALRSLERGAEGQISSSGTPEKSMDLPTTHVVLLISDGEDHEGTALEVARKLKEKGVRLFVLGVGTEKGGPIPIRDEQGSPSGFKRDRSGQVVMSTFHPDFLQKVAQAADGRYWTLTDSEAEVQEFLRDLGNLDRQSFQERYYRVYNERFQIPLLIAILLFFLELSIPARKQRAKVAQMVTCLALALVFPRPGYSEGFSESYGPTALDVYLQNQKGLDAYKSGQIEEARKSFGSAQARDPSRPELEYNQGVVELENGDPERAAEAFLKSAKSTRDPSLESRSYYNLGQALTKKGDLKSAIQSYVSAIDAARRAKDPGVEERSRKNLQLLVAEQKKQKQQSDDKNQDQKKSEEKKPDQEQSSQDKQGSKQSEQKKPDQTQSEKKGNESSEKDQKDKKGDEKNEKSSLDPKDSEKQKSENQKPENLTKDRSDLAQQNPTRSSDTGKFQKKDPQPAFNSKKMAAEDADRVMRELAEREKQLQEKLQKGRTKTQNNPKDW